MPRGRDDSRSAVPTATRPSRPPPGPRRSGAAPRRDSLDDASPRFLLHVVPGIEDIALYEARTSLKEIALVGAWRRFDERTSILEVRGTFAPSELAGLDTVEDVFIVAAQGRDPRPGEAGLGDVSAIVLTSRALAPALKLLASIRKRPAKTFRVVSRLSGSHGFRRVDAQRAVESALRTRLTDMRHLDEDEADVEFWVSIVSDTVLVGLRLSEASMRGPRGEIRPLPASLKPTVARAMVRLSEPTGADVVVDPCLGAGTLLIERGLMGDFSGLIGGDKDRTTANRARANARDAGVNMAVKEWDARHMPIGSASADVVLSNPPFGRQHLIEGEDVDGFYRGLCLEMARILKPAGRYVVVTALPDVFDSAARDAGLVSRRRVGISLRGTPATIFIGRLRQRAAGAHDVIEAPETATAADDEMLEGDNEAHLIDDA